MLFYYDRAAALDNNWLHTWFVYALSLCLDAIDLGTARPTWDTLTENYIEELRGRWALQKDFFALVDSYEAAAVAPRLVTRNAIQSQGDIDAACTSGECLRASDLTPEIAAAAIALGERLFTLLSPLGTRTLHYRQLWNAFNDNVCPFCALTELDDPSLPGEDLDHYLGRKIYPFAAANLNNLAPMCSRCNMDYKRDKDVINPAAIYERHYPYSEGDAGTVCLSGSRFFLKGDDKPPVWRISLYPTSKELEWDRIFDVKNRYELNILNRRYLDWLSEWTQVLPEDFVDTDNAICDSLKMWAEDWAARGLHEKSFLKSAYLNIVRENLLMADQTSMQLYSVIRSQISMSKREIAA